MYIYACLSQLQSWLKLWTTRDRLRIWIRYSANDTVIRVKWSCGLDRDLYIKTIILDFGTDLYIKVSILDFGTIGGIRVSEPYFVLLYTDVDILSITSCFEGQLMSILVLCCLYHRDKTEVIRLLPFQQRQSHWHMTLLLESFNPFHTVVSFVQTKLQPKLMANLTPQNQKNIYTTAL